jgi:hypothetical protein
MHPEYPSAVGNLAALQMMQGDYDAARENVAHAARLLDTDPAPELAVIDALENPALKPRALEVLLSSTDMPDGALFKALYLMMLGEEELTLSNLESAFEKGDPYAVHVNRLTVYDPLRDNPRFQALLEKMNLFP